MSCFVTFFPSNFIFSRFGQFVKKTPLFMNEYIVILNGQRINNKGFFCSSPCVTAQTFGEAKRILSKAKMYYYATFKLDKEKAKLTRIYKN
jgi:hypothetical protein